MELLRRHYLDAFVIALAATEVGVLGFGDTAGRYPAAGLAAAAALVFLARRRQPLVASIVAFAALAGALVLSTDVPSVLFLALMATFAITAAVNRTRDGVVAWGVGALLVGAGARAGDPGNWLGDFLLTMAFCTVMWAAGWLVSRRTRQAELMALRAHAAEQARHIALRDERARIARELHDVVSHGLSVVVLQTVVARSALTDLGVAGTGEVDRHLDAVESTAREALGEMRRMLGLLQVEDLDEGESAVPSPGLRHLQLLVERGRSAGLDVDEVDLDVDAELPGGLELAIYRVVQEALTNAVKHAPGARVRVSTAMEPGQVCVEVIDDGGRGGPGHALEGGHGLIGMRERVALYGGTLDAGAAAGGGFRVRAAFPVGEQDLRDRPTARGALA